MIEAIVTQRHNEAEGICSFELAAADGSALPSFQAGAHIDVHLASGLIRQYSLCPAPGQHGRYLIGVLREPASRGGSAAMHALQIGQGLRISAPRNHFPLALNARRHLLFAGGIGITPVLAMAEHLAEAGHDFLLHYCARSMGRMAFAPRIRTGPIGARATFHLDDGPAGQKLDLDVALGAPQEGTHVYVCGPGGFMDWVLSGARSRGWPEDQLHKEYFSAPAPSAATQEQAFEVQIGLGGAIHAVPAGRSVVEVLAKNGIEIAVSCEQGVCGTCLTRVLDGTPDHRDVFLTDREHAANDCFMPCCSRALSHRLVLDL
ncbi:MAG TPA: PDR/VanB family oxidoreductase [Ramlibacter sp.]|nr:PDR/VanB family oxidoreductase [Ramlibacter sp.]